MYFLLVALSKGTKHTQTEMNKNTLPPPLPKGDENQQDQEDTTLSTDNRSNGDIVDNEEDIILHVDLPPLIPFESNEQQEHTDIDTTDNEESTFELVTDHHTPTPIQIGNPQEDERSIPVLTITLGTFQRNQNQHHRRQHA